MQVIPNPGGTSAVARGYMEILKSSSTKLSSTLHSTHLKHDWWYRSRGAWIHLTGLWGYVRQNGVGNHCNTQYTVYSSEVHIWNASSCTCVLCVQCCYCWWVSWVSSGYPNLTSSVQLCACCVCVGVWVCEFIRPVMLFHSLHASRSLEEPHDQAQMLAFWMRVRPGLSTSQFSHRDYLNLGWNTVTKVPLQWGLQPPGFDQTLQESHTNTQRHTLWKK